MTKLTNEIINSTNGLSSGTYVVEDTITLSHDLAIPKDVTLIFQGGKFVVTNDCTEEITITGSNTRLEAPICTVFGKDINVKGTWDIDRAYPQWFELDDSEISDWATPINKAITMKRTGEVFLKEGVYEISTSIKVTKGIRLIGDNSQKLSDSEGVLIKPSLKAHFENDYMIHANTHYVYNCTDVGCDCNNKCSESCDCKIYPYINYSTMIQNIRFTAINGDSDIPTQKCILAGGGVHLDNLRWENILQAVKYTDTYNDGKSVTNCIFGSNFKSENSTEIYAFDMGFLGDALKFEHNGISETANGKALRLSNCGGASIQGNVINGDILIESSKAVVFNANHCENGMQIEIVDSCVTTNNNYIWKGAKPSYLIYSSGSGDKSVVSLNNDMLIVINDVLDKNNSDENKLKDQMNSLAEYDISLDKDTILNIENVFRYDVGTYGFGKMYPFGIRLCTNNKSSSDGETYETHGLEEFNKYSYLSSCKSSILSGFEIRMQGTIKQVNAPNVYCMMSNEGVFWLGEAGTYRYYYQIIWDKDRNIKKTFSSISTSNTVYNINRYSYDNDDKLICYNDIDIEEGQEGVLLVMDEDTNGNCSMVRLIREKVNDNSNQLEHRFQDVYVPVCGSRYLYDNGISVCGYKWSEPFQFLLLETSDKNMEMLRVIDGNVECFTKRADGITPTSGWKRGDIIYNISSTPSITVVPEDK